MEQFDGFKIVGRTTQGYWDAINKQGFENDYPFSKFIVDKPSKFIELSEGNLYVLDELEKGFLKLKKQQTKQNGGKWIIW